jgi:hypothetical protein
MQSIAVKASSDSAPDYRVKYVPGTIYLLSDLALYVMIDCRTGSGFMELPCRFLCEGEKEITAPCCFVCGFESTSGCFGIILAFMPRPVDREGL